MAASDNLTPGASPSRSRAQRSKLGDAVWNVLTALLLLGVLVVGGVFLLIFNDPYHGLNPFPPPTIPVVMVLPSSTPTPEDMLVPENTPLLEVQISETATFLPSPSATLTPSPTATFALPAITVSPSPTLRATATPGGYAFVPQEGSPDAIPYSIYSDVGCNYMGVGGRVIGLDGSPVTPGVIVRLAGRLEGQRVSLDTLSGTVTEYGESGFGFQLADQPIASRASLYVQLLDQAYLPMSDRIYFDTYDSCDKNLIFITFRQMR